ncbi:hypothetical protein [Carboxylicivirga marina]|uniref:hypothetical protein n=1 Tax=Carboxylicivirga marina TaxID=2800988 RepID=UPI002596F348|nr:hypothetical protein [uncultured Carboxylicivirga sp.]
MMRTVYTIIFAALILANCSFQKEKTTGDSDILTDIIDLEIEKEKLSPLESVNRRDTLIIAFEGTEFGEWGGHRETFFFQRSTDDIIVARFLRDSVPFDINNNGAESFDITKRIIVQDTLKTLNITEEKLVKDFIQRITELNLKGPVLSSNAGDLYLIRNTNKSLNIHFWNSGNIMETGYLELKSSIFGEIDK